MTKHTAETYTDAELLALYRQCEADILACGQSNSVRGKTMTFADLGEVRKQIDRLESRIARQTTRPTYALVRRVRT